MEFYTFNLKEFNPTVELALANLIIEIERGKKYGVKGIKFIHGYGSHGVGGGICLAVHKYLFQLKRNGKIKTFIKGASWNFSNAEVLKFVENCPTASGDIDLNSGNVGVTIVIL